MELSIEVTLDQSNDCHFSGRFCTFSKINTYLTIYRSKKYRNLVEMWFTKSYSICKNFSFFWILDCYQISILRALLHAENCCTIADKIHSKTEVSLIQFLWNFYSIFYDKCTACIQNFNIFQIDLISQTQTWSLLAQFFNVGQISSNWAILVQIESNLKSTWLNTFTRHIYIQSTY